MSGAALNLAEDPDISMMSSPAVYPSNLAVASINSTINMQSVLSWNDAQGQSHTVPFSDPNEVAMKGKFPESQSFVVYDAGYGTYMDYYKAEFSNGYNGGKTGDCPGQARQRRRQHPLLRRQDQQCQQLLRHQLHGRELRRAGCAGL